MRILAKNSKPHSASSFVLLLVGVWDSLMNFNQYGINYSNAIHILLFSQIVQKGYPRDAMAIGWPSTLLV